MTEPWWKIAASYLWPIHIESRSSDYNPELYIELSKGRYQLSTANAIYSHEDKYDNFGEILTNRLDLSQIGDEVLILGLGLGSIPIILDTVDPGRWSITAVEIDEEVVDLATIYAYPKILSDINTISTDAAIYVDIDSRQYDLICIDLFIGDKTPLKFQSLAFLSKIKELLTPEGIVIYNTLAFTKEDKKISESFFEERFREVYRDAEMIYAHRNYMLINDKRWIRR